MNARKRHLNAMVRRVRMLANMAEHYAKLAHEARECVPNRSAPGFYEKEAAEYSYRAFAICNEARVRGYVS